MKNLRKISRESLKKLSGESDHSVVLITRQLYRLNVVPTHQV
ncbi:bacteriocin-like protein [Chryseobacterium sp. FH2]